MLWCVKKSLMQMLLEVEFKSQKAGCLVSDKTTKKDSRIRFNIYSNLNNLNLYYVYSTSSWHYIAWYMDGRSCHRRQFFGARKRSRLFFPVHLAFSEAAGSFFPWLGSFYWNHFFSEAHIVCGDLHQILLYRYIRYILHSSCIWPWISS